MDHSPTQKSLTLDWALRLQAGLLALFTAGCATPRSFDAVSRRSLASSVIHEWMPASRLTALRLIEKYGPPDAIAEGGLGWKDKGRWRRIIVWDAAQDSVAEDGGHLQQTVAYEVPEARREAVERFSDKVRITADGTGLSARSSDEALNFLALNLAQEIGRGAREPEPARLFYEKTAALAAAGKTSAYLEDFLVPD